jgi:hypothetical protein
VAKLQFAATWVRIDIICASAGASQLAALHHFMEYLEGNPSFKITYQRSEENSKLLSEYADSDWGNSCRKLGETRALSTAEAEY